MSVPFLFLDDSISRRKTIQSRYPWATLVETAEQCIQLLEKHSYRVISLDHDLGLTDYQNSIEKNCGMEVIRYLETHQENSNLDNGVIWILHSFNVHAAVEMEARLLKLYKNIRVFRIPYEPKFYMLTYQ